MIEGLPIPVGLGVLGSGWMLALSFIWFVSRRLVTGELMTRREGDAMKEEILVLRASNEEQGKQLTDLTRTQSAALSVMYAIHKAAEEKMGA